MGGQDAQRNHARADGNRTDEHGRPQPAAQDQCTGDEGANDTAHTDGRVEQAGARFAHVVVLDGKDDGEHAQPAEHESADDVDRRDAEQRAHYGPQRLSNADGRRLGRLLLGLLDGGPDRLGLRLGRHGRGQTPQDSGDDGEGHRV